MEIRSIASSSKGNCTVISSGDTNILIDCGISAKQIAKLSGLDSFDAVFISHEHGDHIGGVGVMGRKHCMPIYIHEESYKAKKNYEKFYKNCDIIYWEPEEDITVGDLTVHNFTSRHDSCYSYGFTVSEKDGKKLGYLTDSGSISKLMLNSLKGCDAYFLEADYDKELLENHDDYAPILKERIMSNWGHLSNDQTMKLIKDLDMEQPEFIIFGHLSDKTNSPELVLEALEKTQPKWDMNKIFIAPLIENIIEL